MQIEINDLDETLTENFINFCCEELDIKPEILTVDGWETPFPKNQKATGLCYEVNNGEYWIMTQTKNRNLTEVYITIAHEMVHVKQFIKQGLSDKYSDKRPHHDRWWEREANAKSVELVKKYVDILYNMV